VGGDAPAGWAHRRLLPRPATDTLVRCQTTDRLAKCASTPTGKPPSANPAGIEMADRSACAAINVLAGKVSAVHFQASSSSLGGGGTWVVGYSSASRSDAVHGRFFETERVRSHGYLL
jgi:hypothetical protein